MLHITENEVRRLLPMEEAVRLLRHAFAEWREGRGVNQIRRRMTMPGGVGLHSMAGAVGKNLGTKFYSTSPTGYAFHFMPYDSTPGEALAQFEANWPGPISTGGAKGPAPGFL